MITVNGRSRVIQSGVSETMEIAKPYTVKNSRTICIWDEEKENFREITAIWISLSVSFLETQKNENDYEKIIPGT